MVSEDGNADLLRSAAAYDLALSPYWWIEFDIFWSTKMFSDEPKWRKVASRSGKRGSNGRHPLSQ
ncbi:MAG: hypothetical protein CM15mP74_32870 [Halieaceae bacterium]|nr:MAG: hypothetical protein CM15mP74_32870 [Halieaceae bacterium]